MSGYDPFYSSTPSAHSCPYCGCWHTGTCPRVKSIEYHSDGTIKRIEFHGAVQALEAKK